jgi:transcriptional regulator with XRE-family HTH domain
MTGQALSKIGYTILGVSEKTRCKMPKQKTRAAASFGQRLAVLRKAAGYTQQELADEVDVSRRMIAYYEGQSEHPPTTLLPALAQALQLSTDELLGLEPPTAKRAGRPRDNRLQRRLQQIESLPPEERRQLIQIVDAFIERGQLKRRAGNRTSG